MTETRELILNTPEEEEEINRGAAQDPDNPIMTDEELAEMRPMREVMPEFVEAMARTRRGPQRWAGSSDTVRPDRGSR